MIGLSVDTFDFYDNDFLDDGITTRSISGSVTDGDGEAIPAVRITLQAGSGTVVSVSYTGTDGSYALRLHTVPEPGSHLLILLSAMMVCHRRRQRSLPCV
jgi:hypothetical protein